MPYGMFGPKHYPPRGVPIFDLPMEYLAWFAVRGFPEGKLGRLLRIVYETRAADGDTLFDAFRRACGGRTRFKPRRKREWTFE